MRASLNLLLQSVRKISIQRRLLIIFLLLSLVPSLSIGFFAYNIYTSSINNKLSYSASKTIKLLNSTLSTELERYAFYINSLSISARVQQIMSDSPYNSGNVGLEDVQAIRNQILETTIQPVYLKNIRIADIEGNVIYDLGYDDVAPDDYKKILAKVNEASPEDALTHVRTFRSVDNLVIGRKIYDFPNAQSHIGYILIYINEKLLSDVIYPDINYGDRSDIFLVDQDANVLSASDPSYIGTNIGQEELFSKMIEAHSHGTDAFDTTFKGDDLHTVYSYNEKYNSYFLSTITP